MVLTKELKINKIKGIKIIARLIKYNQPTTSMDEAPRGQAQQIHTYQC